MNIFSCEKNHHAGNWKDKRRDTDGQNTKLPPYPKRVMMLTLKYSVCFLSSISSITTSSQIFRIWTFHLSFLRDSGSVFLSDSHIGAATRFVFTCMENRLSQIKSHTVFSFAVGIRAAARFLTPSDKASCLYLLEKSLILPLIWLGQELMNREDNRDFTRGW